MSKMNKKSKIVTGLAVGLATLVGVGAVGLVSKGFKNWDVRDWVDGYKNVLEVKDDSQYLCATCNVDGGFTQEKRAEIKFASVDGGIAHCTAKLYNQDNEELKEEAGTVSAIIGLNDETLAGVEFGFETVSSGPYYCSLAFMLDYNKSNGMLRVICGYDTLAYAIDSGDQHILPSESFLASSSYEKLSYYGIKDVSNIKFSVTKEITETGSVYIVKVGDKRVTFDGSESVSDGNYCIVDDEDCMSHYIRTKGEYPVYLTAYGTEATFKEVKWSE